MTTKITLADVINITKGNSKGPEIPISRHGIVFETERDKYTASPHNWTDIKSESFLVWMKTSAVTPLRKLYGKINVPISGDIVIKIQNSMSVVLTSPQ